MKKKYLNVISVFVFLILLVWMGCNPFQENSKTSNHKLLDNNGLDGSDAVRASASVKFAAFGDTGNNDSGSMQQDDVANLVKSLNPDFIVHVGDVNQGDSGNYDYECGENYHEYIGNYTGSYGTGASVNMFFPVLGNHDVSSSYLSFFTLPGISGNTSGNESYYDYVQGPVHLFVINSNSGTSQTSAQGVWLQSQLAASTSTWNLVYFHHTAYSSCPKHGSTTAMQWPFEDWGADAVFSGHNHVYERVLKDADSDGINMPYFTVGLGGFGKDSFTTAVSGSQVRYNSDFGVLIAEASDSSITFEFHNLSNSTIDTYTINATAGSSSSSSSTSSSAASSIISSSSSSSVSSAASSAVSSSSSSSSAGSNIIFEKRISASTDDAEERSSGSMYLNSTDLELVYDSGNQKVGMRFNSITIPKGTVIKSAYIQFKVDETASGTTSLVIKAQSIDNSATFTSTASDITNRTLTTAGASWVPAAWSSVGAAGETQRTPDLKDIIQEIINRDGWAGGNSLSIIITGTGERVAEAYDGDTAGAPLLHIEY